MNNTAHTQPSPLGIAPVNGNHPSPGRSRASSKSEERSPSPSPRNGRSHGRAARGRAGGNGARGAPSTDDRILLDVPALAAALSRRLYAEGVPVTPERAVTFAEALTLMGPLTRSQLYCTARTVFVSAPGHLPVFDRVFSTVFDPSPAAA
jgi:hypothetical protein